jgi:hypothetical protein
MQCDRSVESEGHKRCGIDGVANVILAIRMSMYMVVMFMSFVRDQAGLSMSFVS